MKCIIAGCEIPFRAMIKLPYYIGQEWPSCGKHRYQLIELVNGRKIDVDMAINKYIHEITNAVDEMGDHKAELDVQWNQLNSRANAFMNNIIPEFNKQLWDAGIGAIKMY